jgi:hypothetical protein
MMEKDNPDVPRGLGDVERVGDQSDHGEEDSHGAQGSLHAPPLNLRRGHVEARQIPIRREPAHDTVFLKKRFKIAPIMVRIARLSKANARPVPHRNHGPV